MAPWFHHWGLRPVSVVAHDEAVRVARRCRKPARASAAAADADDATAAAADGDQLPELSVVLCSASKAVERDVAGLVSAMDALGAKPCVVTQLTPFQASCCSALVLIETCRRRRRPLCRLQAIELRDKLKALQVVGMAQVLCCAVCRSVWPAICLIFHANMCVRAAVNAFGVQPVVPIALLDSIIQAMAPAVVAPAAPPASSASSNAAAAAAATALTTAKRHNSFISSPQSLARKAHILIVDDSAINVSRC